MTSDTLEQRPERRVLRATVTGATHDVAMLKGSDGRALLLPATEIPADTHYAAGDKVTVLLMRDGDQPMVSASHPQLIAALMEAIIPEVRSGKIRVMAVARTAGRRAKVAVAATEDGVDPIPVCVGRDANRVKALIAALGGERVDIVPWHPDRDTFLRNALNPAEVIAVRIDGEDAEAVVPVQQMSAAVGQGGLNSALAGKLTGLQVTIVAEA